MEINCRAIARPRNNSTIGTLRYIQSVITLSSNKCEIHKLTIKNSKYCKEFVINDNIVKIFEKRIRSGVGTISFKNPPFDVLLYSSKVAELQALFKRICTCNPGITIKFLPATKKIEKIMQKTAVTMVKSTTISKKRAPKSLVITDYSQCVKNSRLSQTLKSIMILAGAIKPTTPLDTLSILENLQKIYITNNCIDIIPESLGNLRLFEVILINNKFGIHFNWNWLKGKAIQNSLAKLDLSQNKINVFPNEILRCTKLHELRLQNNSIRRIPYGIHCLKSLSVLDVSENILDAIPNSLERLTLKIIDLSGNAVENNTFKTILVVTNKFPSLLLLAGQAVIHFKLTYNDKTIPHTLVDTLKQSPICVCGKLSFYDYSAFVAYTLNCQTASITYSGSVGINKVIQQVFSCSKKCLLKRCFIYVPKRVTTRRLCFF